MSHLSYFSYDASHKMGKKYEDMLHYLQAIRIGNHIECLGQGGWDSNTGVIVREINTQIDKAFENVDMTLKTAGGKGWEQASPNIMCIVYHINTYHVPINDEALEVVVCNLKKWVPNHKPIWTCVGMTRLAFDDMRIEIEVVAHNPETHQSG